jgi:ATP-dependent RNA helicase DeaD
MSTHSSEATSFRDLSLIAPIIDVLDEIGYESPSPIQAATIPFILNQKHLLGQAQTGTGKTAAFALPILCKIDLSIAAPQAMILAPTRELAIQVAEAFQRYASHLKGFHVLPIYGGQEYGGQLRALKRGPQVIVGTPGRVMDHMRRKSLRLDQLKHLVLDEADEMLRMGFIDDIEWILEETPAEKQIILFSATMPKEIKKIAQTYLVEPEIVAIKQKTTTAATITQRYWQVSNVHKLDALTRILEVESFDGIIIFVRTKAATVELSEKLEARGYNAAALNGDLAQKQREATIEKLKNKTVDILVATDVAARGLDVERITHVVNYDIPYDAEAYVHRIGRTGRAGRSGTALLFVTPRETRMLQMIEKATRQPIERSELPSTSLVNEKRGEKFKQQISTALNDSDLSIYQTLISEYEQEHNIPAIEIAAALAKVLQGDVPLFLDKPTRTKQNRPEGKQELPKRSKRERNREKTDQPPAKLASKRKQAITSTPEKGMERFRLDVGSAHGAKPSHIVGAIANEAGIEGRYINQLCIFDNYSTVDLPEGMPKEIFQDLKKARVAGRSLRISRFGELVEQIKKPTGKNSKKRRQNPFD